MCTLIYTYIYIYIYIYTYTHDTRRRASKGTRRPEIVKSLLPALPRPTILHYLLSTIY